MMRKLSILALTLLMICLLLGGCSLIGPKLEFEDITLEFGKTYELPTEASGLTGTEPIEYSFSGKNISITDGILKALVAETVTEVTAKCGSAEAKFKVTVVLSSNVEDDGKEPDDENNGSGDNGEDEVVDYGTMTVKAPAEIYSNYAGKDITVTFSKPEYASDVVFTTDNSNVKVIDGKIAATGKFDSAVSVNVTAKSTYHEKTFTVKVSTYQGNIGVEDAVFKYEQDIIKPENEGGMYAHAAVKMLRTLNERFADYDPSNDAMITHGTVRYPIPGVYTEKQAGVHISIIYGDYFFTEGILKLLGSDYFAW